MASLTAEQLRQIMPAAPDSSGWTAVLNRSFAEFEVDSPARMPLFWPRSLTNRTSCELSSRTSTIPPPACARPGRRGSPRMHRPSPSRDSPSGSPISSTPVGWEMGTRRAVMDGGSVAAASCSSQGDRSTVLRVTNSSFCWRPSPHCLNRRSPPVVRPTFSGSPMASTILLTSPANEWTTTKTSY
jgi:hypothetical protein